MGYVQAHEDGQRRLVVVSGDAVCERDHGARLRGPSESRLARPGPIKGHGLRDSGTGVRTIPSSASARCSIVVAFWKRYRDRSSSRFAFTRALAALCRSFAAFARSRSSCSGAFGRGAGGNTARSDGADVGTLSLRGSMAPRTARPGIRVVGCASRNTKIAARPSVRFVKVYVEAYGCTQNYGEARLMQEALLGSGHTITTAEADADAHVLVTCTVVETTERKMARRMAELAVYDKPFVVAGCMAAAQRDRVRSIVPRAKLLPPRKWPQIVERLGAGTACGDRAAEIESTSFGWRDAIVPIAQGCAGRCTYCITRVARGWVASYPIDAIVAEVRRHVGRGVREIKLTGQDTAAYGLDAGTNLATLLRAVDDLPGEFRVRVGMADPLTVYPIRDDLVDAYASEKVFKFLHLPVQSGDDRILEAMRRQYTVSQFEEIVRTFRGAYPDITLSTDVIVGFPGESEEQFEATMELIRRVRPDIVNVTRFSPREGTPAATMPGRIVGWKVKERSRRLTRLRFQIAREMNERFIGREATVLVTEPGKPGTVLARTPEYRQVVLREPATIGEFLRVEIDGARPTDLSGHLLTNGLYTAVQIHAGSPVV